MMTIDQQIPLPDNMHEAHAEIVILRRMVANLEGDNDRLSAMVYNVWQTVDIQGHISDDQARAIGNLCEDVLLSTFDKRLRGRDTDEDAA